MSKINKILKEKNYQALNDFLDKPNADADRPEFMAEIVASVLNGCLTGKLPLKFLAIFNHMFFEKQKQKHVDGNMSRLNWLICKTLSAYSYCNSVNQTKDLALILKAISTRKHFNETLLLRSAVVRCNDFLFDHLINYKPKILNDLESLKSSYFKDIFLCSNDIFAKKVFLEYEKILGIIDTKKLIIENQKKILGNISINKGRNLALFKDILKKYSLINKLRPLPLICYLQDAFGAEMIDSMANNSYNFNIDDDKIEYILENVELLFSKKNKKNILKEMSSLLVLTAKIYDDYSPSATNKINVNNLNQLFYKVYERFGNNFTDIVVNYDNKVKKKTAPFLKERMMKLLSSYLLFLVESFILDNAIPPVKKLKIKLYKI